MINNIYILIIAALLDYLIGDPWGWPHPVRVMGWIISWLSKFFLQHCQSSLTQRLAGIVIAMILIVGSGLSGWLIIQIARWLNPLLGIVLESILLGSCFALHSLRTAAVDVIQPLTIGKLEEARQILSNYVGRDTTNLSAAEVLRAVLETVTENATDGVMAPLFYAILGAFMPLVGVVPLALAYKASSTLDSMVGYREAPYTYIGWFSARLEDGLTWLPCRLTVMTLALLSLKPVNVWRICHRDAIQDPSPNSGWSECAYAAILGVQMGGINWYRGVAKHKPFLGDAIYPITPTSIHQALQLTRYSFLLWLGLAIFLIRNS
ncbi:cobalamin biosynthesis protein [Anabaena cylindrica FACHB-243]|uniref:Cobalamin biosynthesis protein CobD n=1 Tax=Anabaena cylindrica (strain ATCC 27899 / PCC 7122) TaxID=272123 RepID=K9ZJK2_ANACC|nr:MULTISPECIES: adenosylcobinamide-phosphate synthase CbiB [Anabaena]AFZ58954.1 adenosylcobinamide-phosphate synthase [Anabaena cylindrica PCC 7122]MBD2420701.1 cobalamin biosynthesis protein [Anabaena cylindrica FACHB-243]MBY5284395.1 cobalamin biosynthesis protein [Anabaena sp. CCAP 1446/1C]MBY5306682.1 cobalamin biosynthesis protein [Anabaena sp. CCAP 1446/1C]MCM2408405.1 adenosylcobinamide-phosphate synthase CbiB [Anabaena sp. CCAP 1446/1C]